MSQPFLDRAGLNRLLAKLVDGMLTEEDRTQLEAFLRNHSAARRHYFQYLDLHAELAARLDRADLAPRYSLPSMRVVRFLLSPRWVAIAAMLMLVGYFAGLFTLLGLSRTKRQEKREVAAVAVASVRNSTDVKWSNKTKSRGDDAPIEPGESLKIDSGLVTLQLKQGTTLFVEGPAEWSINGENSAILQRGKLVAKVPHDAIGFTLRTPTARIVDLGTEFGVEVNKNGTAVVQVLKGQVEVGLAITDIGTRAGIKVSAGEAVRVDSRAVTIFVPFEPLSLTRRIADRKTPEPTIAQLSGLRLWLRADKGIELDDNGRVRRWADQSGKGFDAAQVQADRRPLPVKRDGNAAITAVQFDGKTTFLECTRGLDLDLAKELTICVVFTHFGSFRNSAGLFSLRSRFGTDWQTPDGISLSQQLNENQGNDILVHYGSTGPKLSLRGEIPVEMPLILTLTKDGPSAALRFNGKAADFGQEPKPEEDRTRSVNQAGYCLGARFDDGHNLPGYGWWGESSIAEVLVFDRAIDGPAGMMIERELQSRNQPLLNRAPLPAAKGVKSQP